MSQNFKHYSQYYDLLYKDKDYQSETDYLTFLISSYLPTAKNIIELGSGTGKHAKLLAEKGYEVLGLERSSEMVEIANRTVNEGVSFKIADVSNFEQEQSFDVALSIFHVISYLTENEDLINTFNQVKKHLNTDGLFIFDVWHSPAVHAQIPEKRVKRLKNSDVEIIRYATPVIDAERNIVEVNYLIEARNLHNGQISTVEEKHPMRHFGKPEIELLAYATGFKLLHCEEFLSKVPPSDETWGVCYVLRKK
ncbi:class I SAM-dependent DNA methyltransferase [Pedobacter zeae]|uniref:Methyltransferase n=1 Tax=Pedobacter zeae TaxID=1737356 RepID=A0A7W6K9Q6_9SPHI|nr:class I SAM-dependent methyltransferase [Pedobacter zeae]MBB4107803.1 SAM-dependent methyltransferase [Pedobacter zeae]GGG96956.1 methyltransferase [Pedobacter zeae]